MFNPELLVQLIAIRSWCSVVLQEGQGKPLSCFTWWQQSPWYIYLYFQLCIFSIVTAGLRWMQYWTQCSLPSLSWGFLYFINVCSTLCCWCALANNWKTYFSISYLNFQNILVASWDEHCLFKMLKYRIIYVIEIKVQGADTIKNKEHFGYKGWLEIESFQWRCCTADYLWARAVATCL